MVRIKISRLARGRAIVSAVLDPARVGDREVDLRAPESVKRSGEGETGATSSYHEDPTPAARRLRLNASCLATEEVSHGIGKVTATIDDRFHCERSCI
ncbi:hypothetical protein [Phreatobacter sp. AB_2022a]|uniref:hypothetical protein n=1 Tax=Phreatobacter sp. AB_2022a TaxID=3003134 RepID=UPI002286F3F6|nr:hypothetical protein [Phreatobacter sp. AB_2022a]MCZ0738569.1 hypothetical protein [Phreatobacter sp. AB_2022a]